MAWSFLQSAKTSAKRSSQWWKRSRLATAAATFSVGSVSVRATTGLDYWIYIGTDRVMTDGTYNLDYELYSDAGRTSVWGSDLAGAEACQRPAPAASNPPPSGSSIGISDFGRIG